MGKNDISLHDFVGQQLQLTQQLLTTLESEELALVNNDVEALEAITPSKNQLVQVFLSARHKLLQHLQQQGIQPTDQNISAWFEAQPQRAGGNEMAQIKALQKAAKDINTTNGLLIQRLAARNQAGLSALRGQRASGVYGPNGQNGSMSNFRTSV